MSTDISIGREAQERKREMRSELLPWWAQNLIIRGFEEDPKGKKEESEESEDEDEEDEEDDESKKGKEKPEDNEALKSALRKERTERKKLAREIKALAKYKEETEGKEKSETDKAKDDKLKSETKAQKLAVKLKDTAVDNVVIKLAGKLKFRDTDDALKLIDRAAIEVDQDEDEPDQVEVDESSVESALAALAKKKPHLIIAEGQEDKSGSKFGGGKKPTKETEDEALKGKYPALSRSAHTSP